MAQSEELDQRVTNFNFDVEVDRKMRGELSKAGVNKPDDLLSGRADVGRVNELMRSQTAEDEMSPLVQEKIMRDQQFAQTASEEPQAPEPEPSAEEQTSSARLSELQKQAEFAAAESRKWKTVSGRWKDKTTNLEKRLQDLESRMTQNQPFVDSRQLTGKAGEEILTAQEVSNLMMSLANAFGSQINAVRQEVTQKTKPESAVSDLDEAELTYSHPWLENLPDAQKERAMLDIIQARSVMNPTLPSAPAPKPSPAASEQARSQVREANFIETSNRGSRTEQVAQDPQKVALQQKMDKLKDALNKPGGAREAEALFAALGAGTSDDAESSYLRRR